MTHYVGLYFRYPMPIHFPFVLDRIYRVGISFVLVQIPNVFTVAGLPSLNVGDRYAIMAESLFAGQLKYFPKNWILLDHVAVVVAHI